MPLDVNGVFVSGRDARGYLVGMSLGRFVAHGSVDIELQIGY